MYVSNYPQGICIPAIGGMNPFGKTWFVKATGYGSDGAAGDSADVALNTVAKAISLGSAGDTIVLGVGTHNVDVSVAALAAKAQMQFVAAVPPFGGKPQVIVTHDADDGANLATIDVSGVGFHGIEFKIVAGGTTAVNLFDIAQTTAVNGLVFKDCWFNLNSVDKAGVVSAMTIDDATNATTGLVIKNCRFLGGDATTGAANYITVGVGGIPDALIEDNVFVLQSADGDALGINFADPGAANKSYAMTIRNNDFIGAADGGDDAVGIKFAAAMTEDEILGVIRSNYFANCGSSPITVDKVNASIIRNYYGDDATGGTLVDPGT